MWQRGMVDLRQAEFRMRDPGGVESLQALPLFARALVASRVARRAVLAMLDGEMRELGLSACDEIDGILLSGEGWRDHLPGVRASGRAPRTRGSAAALEAVRWAFDSTGAAQGANDFPVDAMVTGSAVRCIEAVRADPRVSGVQLDIVLGSDVDLLTFACREAGVGTYDALGGGVLGRLPPCHALTLVRPDGPVERAL